MAIEALVGLKPAPTRIGPTLLLDALVRETHDRQAEVTAFPVETGATITDHVRLEPREVTIEGFVTDNPVRFLGGIPAGLVRGNIGDNVLGPSLNLVQAATAELERIYQTREPIEVVTPRQRYQNLVMRRLSIPRDRATGRALRFSAAFREIARVETRTVARRRVRTSQERSQPASDAGKQTPPPATAKAETTARSVLFGLKEGLAGFFK